MNKDELKFDLGDRDLLNITEGEFELLLERDRLITEKNIVDKISGIGSLKSEKYQDSLDVINDMLDVISAHKIGQLADVEDELDLIVDDLETGLYDIASIIHGIGSIAGKKERKARKAKRKAGRKEKKAIKKQYKGKEKREKLKEYREEHGTKAGKFLRKTAKVAKKAYTGMWKLATLPMRLILKGILEVSLPKAAPSFLYLFIPEKDVSKMPATVQKKRKKQVFLSNFIIKWIGLKHKHFMKLIANGIKKHYSKSPEELLKQRYKGISGIGVIPIAAVIALIGAVTSLIKVFKGKKKEIEGDVKEFTGKLGLKDFAKLAAPDLDFDYKSGDGEDFFDTRLTPQEQLFDTTLGPARNNNRELMKRAGTGCMVLLTFLIIIVPVLIKFLFSL